MMPPLKIWVVLIISSLAMITGLLAMTSYYERREYESKQAYLSSLLGEADNAYKIMFIGSSLTQCGLDSTKRIEKQIFELSGKKVSIAKMWRRATSLQHLSENLLESSRLKPDLLIVESNMLLYNANAASIQYKLSLALRQIRRKAFRTEYNAEEKPKFVKFDNRDINDFRGELVDSLDLQNFRSVISKLEQEGSRIIFAHFPIQKEAEKQKWMSSDTAVFYSNLQYLSHAVTYQFWQPALALDSSFFRDRAHMNNKGASVMTAWLSNSIASEMKGL